MKIEKGSCSKQLPNAEPFKTEACLLVKNNRQPTKVETVIFYCLVLR